MGTRYKIQMITLTDIHNFINSVSKLEGNVVLENEQGTYRLSAKSFLGAMAAVEDWGDIWVSSEDTNLYNAVKDFVV